MPKYTDEQVERAKNVDVRTFLEQTEGYSFEGHGRFIKCQNPERTGQPSSLSVDTKLNRIFYNSMTGNRPLSAVDWCMKIKDMDFQSTMQFVLGENPQGQRVERPKYQQHKAQENANTYEPKNLELSERSDISKHVYAYLTKTRCIPENIVKNCLDNNLIYEDVRKNAVFVGYDSENKIPKYAARRGTFTPDGKEPFKRDCTGSDKNFAFRLEGKNTETVYVAEAAIDVLSLAALEDKFHGSGAYKEKTYLSTGGAGIDSALEQFCKTHDVKTINICFDNDEAGKNGMEKVMQKFREKGYTVNDMRASLAHDYNDELVAFSNDPNFYSKPPDVAAGSQKIKKERSVTMPEQNILVNDNTERIEKALNEIVSHYDCLYTMDDLKNLSENDKIYIADMYSKRPYDINNVVTYEMDSSLDGAIFEAININEFKKMINADKLRQQGIEIEEIKTKENIRDDFYYEPSMTAEDLEFSFGETISSISFKNQDRETVTFKNYFDLKNALSDPDSVLMRSAAQIERSDFIPFDDYSMSDVNYRNQQELQEEIKPVVSPEPEHNIPETSMQNPEKAVQEKPTAETRTVRQEVKSVASPEPEHNIPEKSMQNPEKAVHEKPTAETRTVRQEVKSVVSPEPEHNIPEKSMQNPEKAVQEKPTAETRTVRQEVKPVASPEPEHNIPDKSVEKIGLFAIQYNGEERFYKTNRKANELLNIAANSQNKFADMKEQGQRISNSEYAEIMQSSSFKFSVDMDFDSNSANIYAVNNGKGGIAENERNKDNTLFKKVSLLSFVKSEQKSYIHETSAQEYEKTENAYKSAIPVRNTESEPVQQEKTASTVHGIEQFDTNKKMNVFLASLKDNQERKRSELLDKIENIEKKISGRQERINNLNSKISDIETSLKTAAAFKRVFGNTVIGGLIDKNIEKKQEKIKQIKEEKIPKQENKIKRQTDKKIKKTSKLGKVNRKIDRLDKVQDFLSALGSKDKEIRHKGFVTGLENLSDIRRESLESKLSKIQTKIDMLSANISSPDISNIERLKLSREIRNLQGKSSDISAKIKDIHNLRNDLDNMKSGKISESEIETAVNRTADKISQRLEKTAAPEDKGIVNHIISQAVESGGEAVSEVVEHKSAERDEKAEPDLDRERVPEEREPEVTVSTEQQILTSIAAITGVSIAEMNRLPVELKADIIAEFRENSGNMPTEKLAEIICETIDIKPPAQEQKQPENEKNTPEQKSKENDTRKTFEDMNKPLFSRSAIMSKKYKPTYSKSADDIERDRQNRNKQAEL